jgi:predicted transcriptional regulator
MKNVTKKEIEIENFEKWSINNEIQKGFDEIERGEFLTAEEVFKQLDKKYGIKRV